MALITLWGAPPHFKSKTAYAPHMKISKRSSQIMLYLRILKNLKILD